MTGLLIGCARVSTDEQDLTAQLEALTAMGVRAERVYVDKGLTGENRARPGLWEALAACRAGDTCDGPVGVGAGPTASAGASEAST